MSWVRHASCLTSMISFTRLMGLVLLMLKNKRLKMKIEKNTLLLLQNSQFLLTTRMNGSNLRIYLSVTLVCLLASEKKLVLLVEKPGVFTECINSRKSNNSFSQNLKTLGKNSREWSVFPRNSCKLLDYLTESSTLSLELWMMLLLRNTIWKHGSLVMVNTRSSFPAVTALISNLEDWTSQQEKSLSIKRQIKQLRNSSCTCSTEHSVQLKEPSPAYWRTTKKKKVSEYLQRW